MRVSGLYIVALREKNAISVNANDRRIADRCIKVNRDHCKFGKARDLSVREKNYRRVFGERNVAFMPIAAVEDIAAAERVVLKDLDHYRIPGTSGRKKNEFKAARIKFTRLGRFSD